MHCSVTCVTCTQHDDMPVVLVTEETDHAEVGDDHHERMGGCFAVAARHTAAYPEHVLKTTHETQTQVTRRVEAEERRLQRRRDQLGYVDPEESIRRRKLRMEQARQADRQREAVDPLTWAARGR